METPNNNLETQIIALLQQQHKEIATAESCTGGMISQRLTAVAGASQVFSCGICSYANRIKEQILGVSCLKAYGAVSSQTAAEMAEGVRMLAGADIALSVTGIAGPGGGTSQKPVGLVYIGVSTCEQTKTYQHLFTQTTREEIRQAAAQTALEHAYAWLTQQSVTP